MRTHLFTGVILCAFSFFLSDNYSVQSKFITGNSGQARSGNGISDFNVLRLSGERVMISWHTEDELQPVRFEVMRKHDKSKPFVSLGTVEPRSKEGNSATYSFIDLNNFPDTTFYCLKKTKADSVIFYSISKPVEGVGKER